MKGICLKEPLFKSTLAKIKTETRCLIVGIEGMDFQKETFAKTGRFIFSAESGLEKEIKPTYRINDIVALKEPMASKDGKWSALLRPIIAKYDTSKQERGRYKWTNKLFMPTKYARYFIRINGVRIERVQEIAPLSILSEGVKAAYAGTPGYDKKQKAAFEKLWNHINKAKQYQWNANPYVWVYSYELLSVASSKYLQGVLRHQPTIRSEEAWSLVMKNTKDWHVPAKAIFPKKHQAIKKGTWVKLTSYPTVEEDSCSTAVNPKGILKKGASYKVEWTFQGNLHDSIVLNGVQFPTSCFNVELAE